ncbi:MAG: translation initiation factor IF-2 [Bacteroidales bacterium]|nr:translation initiation factor IF-2 [Bacteroidales bacterium]
MAEGKRVSKLASELNVGVNSIADFLKSKGYNEEVTPNTKVPDEFCAMLEEKFNPDRSLKKQSEKIGEEQKHKQKKETISIQPTVEAELVSPDPIKAPKVVGKIDLSNGKKPAAPQHNNNNNNNKQEQKPAQPKPQQQQPKPAEAQPKPLQQPKPQQAEEEEDVFKLPNQPKLSGPVVLGKIDLPVGKTDAYGRGNKKNDKKKRQRIQKENERVDLSSPNTIKQVNNAINRDKQKKNGGQQNGGNNNGQQKQNGGQNNNNFKQNGGQQNGGNNNNGQQQRNKDKKNKRPQHQEVNEEDVQKEIKETLARLTAKGAKSQHSKHRRDKREELSQRRAEEEERMEADKKILKVTEFVTTSELASMMGVPVNQVIATFMSLGTLVSINQRLDAESMAIVAEEFGYKVEFVSVEVASAEEEIVDDEADLQERPPIVTVMGHVDHGKTSLLDYIRKTNVISGEAGGITQHIGAYNVTLESGRHITFLDTPGHEAFTAMRARGAQVTDVAIIIVAADDSVMPQTVEAINHASAANVPIIFAINKIDKPGANPDKIREALANMNYLVEEWGGKYQCQEISAKKGLNVDKLLDKVLLEADMLELKANPNRQAVGNVIESSLDKGRGYIATLLVSNGTLSVGDMVVCGSNYGRVKAMFNERNQKVEKAGPSEPVLVLGLNGAPTAGEKFNVFADEREAKEVATKRDQLIREQQKRTHKHLTLDEIGRRLAIGNFQELNVIVKADFDGSVQALSESLMKLSTEEIQVNVVHSGVGQISEADVNLAAASNAIIVGFQVRPSSEARKLAEREEIDIRLYSIIYDAIEELKDAMEGMLSPEIKEQVNGNVEVRETFKISKVGTIAGCFVNEGKIKSKSKVRVIRDGIVVYTGELGSLKRFKDDAKEVVAGLDCGLSITNYNDIQVGDILEAYEEIEISRKL